MIIWKLYLKFGEITILRYLFQGKLSQITLLKIKIFGETFMKPFKAMRPSLDVDNDDNTQERPIPNVV